MNEIDKLRKLAGITEAPVVMTAQDFEAGKRPKTAKDRDAYRKWKSGDSGKAAAKGDGPMSISPKDAKDAAARPAKAAAANPNNAKFGTVKPEDMIGDKGEPIPSRQRKKSVANMFPADVDINDPAEKKQVFLQVASKRPDLLFGEINARLANDDENFAISDRLSDIVRELEDTRNIMKLSQEDKTFALKVMQKAIDDMELVRATDIDVKLSDRPEQPAVDDEDDLGTDDEFDVDDDEMAPVLDKEDELEDSVNFDDIRAEYGIEEGDWDDDDFQDPPTAMCPDCEGSGESHGERCERCGGHGEVFEGADEAPISQMSDAELADYLGVSESEVAADRDAAEDAADDKARGVAEGTGTYPCKKCSGTGKVNGEDCDHCGGTGEHAYESYSPGDELEAEMESDCCGAPIADVHEGYGRCTRCYEMAEAVPSEVAEAIDATATNAFEAALAELRTLAGI